MTKTKDQSKYYITTAIAYPNAHPHLGHAWEFLGADVIARYQRLIGKDVFFLTGTDEHGVKISNTAKKEGITPKELVEKNTPFFKELLEKLNITNDDFIRTTESRHKKSAQAIWKKVNEAGYIYKKSYSGLYCEGCECFKKPSDLVEGKCPDHDSEPELVEEENYFFKLSEFQDRLLKFYNKNPNFVVPKTRFNEIISLTKEGLEDISISRPKTKLEWGINVPGDPDQVMYVWFDALTNYITGVGYPDEKKMQEWWPANVHVIGKDVMRFHIALWPAMLLAAGFKESELPEQILVHGFLKVEGSKMSKSTGNVIDPLEILERYGTETIRYFLLREVPFHKDGDISEEKIIERYNGDLAKGLGNLVSRVSTMLHKFSDGKVPDVKDFSSDFVKIEQTTWTKIDASLAELEFHTALQAIWKFIDALNVYVDAKKPWEMAKDESPELDQVLYDLINGVFLIGRMIHPFLPETSKKISELFEQKNIPAQNGFTEKYHTYLKPGESIAEADILFPTLDKNKSK